MDRQHIIASSRLACAIRAPWPVAALHTLIVPNHHATWNVEIPE
jgi:diadenosine tetraphosphate (Ap4A) HIT family hydrolase